LQLCNFATLHLQVQSCTRNARVSISRFEIRTTATRTADCERVLDEFRCYRRQGPLRVWRALNRSPRSHPDQPDAQVAPVPSVHFQGAWTKSLWGAIGEFSCPRADLGHRGWRIFRRGRPSCPHPRVRVCVCAFPRSGGVRGIAHSTAPSPPTTSGMSSPRFVSCGRTSPRVRGAHLA